MVSRISRSPHKLNLSESIISLGGVSRVRLIVCSPANEDRSNSCLSAVTWQLNELSSPSDGEAQRKTEAMTSKDR